MPNLSSKSMGPVTVAIPPARFQLEFSLHARPILGQIEVLEDSNDRAAKARDLLLPRLISGKLSVEDLDIQFPPSMDDAA